MGAAAGPGTALWEHLRAVPPCLPRGGGNCHLCHSEDLRFRKRLPSPAPNGWALPGSCVTSMDSQSPGLLGSGFSRPQVRPPSEQVSGAVFTAPGGSIAAPGGQLISKCSHPEPGRRFPFLTLIVRAEQASVLRQSHCPCGIWRCV